MANISDEQFYRELKIAVKPENLIGERMWRDWHNQQKDLSFCEMKVIDVARKKRLTWPGTKAEDTFGYYLEREFSSVKNLLGWDAKRTLLLCIAEECLLNNKENVHEHNENEAQYSDPLTPPGAFSTDEETSVRLMPEEKEVESLVKVFSNIRSANFEFLSVIDQLEAHLTQVYEEKKRLVEVINSQQDNILDLKHLLDGLVKVSQDQIIDVDELKRQNHQLQEDLQFYKAKSQGLGVTPKVAADTHSVNPCGVQQIVNDSISPSNLSDATTTRSCVSSGRHTENVTSYTGCNVFQTKEKWLLFAEAHNEKAKSGAIRLNGSKSYTIAAIHLAAGVPISTLFLLDTERAHGKFVADHFRGLRQLYESGIESNTWLPNIIYECRHFADEHALDFEKVVRSVIDLTDPPKTGDSDFVNDHIMSEPAVNEIIDDFDIKI